MIEELYERYLQSHVVTTDSRQVTPGCIFFALKGDNFDGNAFVPQALAQGAAACVTSDAQYGADQRCYVVPDVLKALQELAHCHRRHLSIPFVGITGTNGKTTTKELVHAVLSKKYRTHATRGNFNNHLGVPLTILSMPADTEVAIVEMGANHPGEIDFLCHIAEPTCGLITNVGRAHLEGFGSFEGVVRTKTELYRWLAVMPEGGSGVSPTIFVNADNAILMDEAAKVSSIPEIPSICPAYIPNTNDPDWTQRPRVGLLSYGSADDAEVKGSCVGCNPYMKFYFEEDDNVYTVQTCLLGAYNFDNAMAAVCVGRHFGVDLFDIKEAIESYVPRNQRSEYRETARGNRLYLDCYNANPSSMEAAIDSFRTLEGRKMAVIGGMHELGADERKEHMRLIAMLEDCRMEQCLLVGPEFDDIDLPQPMRRFADTESVATWLKENPVQGATILVKGSNTNRLWSLEELL
ncbi:MAG: UDP-N-acetylmuramoyl-tripeptide--D-alanyl-D-alanine ligase [Bacteroidales bacterium]|nr:UDP-N-acetylmuramoyl-tripeptide--D-alanyl-D-alanine ligase [Bacteroidales bacterium]